MVMKTLANFVESRLAVCGRIQDKQHLMNICHDFFHKFDQGAKSSKSRISLLLLCISREFFRFRGWGVPASRPDTTDLSQLIFVD